MRGRTKHRDCQGKRGRETLGEGDDRTGKKIRLNKEKERKPSKGRKRREE